MLSLSCVGNGISEEAHRVDHLLEPEGIQIGKELVDSGEALLPTNGEDSLRLSVQKRLLYLEELPDEIEDYIAFRGSVLSRLEELPPHMCPALSVGEALLSFGIPLVSRVAVT
jgi:hypothetical protein